MSSTRVIIAVFCLTLSTVAVDNCTANKTVATTPAEMDQKLGKILITHPQAMDVAKEKLQRHFDVIFPESNPPTREEILRLAHGCVGMLWAHHIRLDAEVLDAAGPQLKAISTISAGLDLIDVPEVKRRNITLGYTPGVLNDAVADQAIGLMIAAARRYREGDLSIRNGEWGQNSHSPRWMLGRDIRGSTVGIVGLGSIGQTIAKRLNGFDIGKLVYTGRNRKPEELEKKFSAHFLSFTDLIKTSDFVIIVLPLTNETRNMFNATVFEQMKPTSVLVNVGRGAIVNTRDLCAALKSGKIFSAGLDVVDPEPLALDDQLLTLPNLVIQPHLGSATGRTRSDMTEIAALNVLAGIAGERLFAPVP